MAAQHPPEVTQRLIYPWKTILDEDSDLALLRMCVHRHGWRGTAKFLLGFQLSALQHISVEKGVCLRKSGRKRRRQEGRERSVYVSRAGRAGKEKEER